MQVMAIISENESRYFIRFVSGIGYPHYELIRRRDDAILFSNRSLSLVADKLYKPVYEDGSPVIL